MCHTYIHIKFTHLTYGFPIQFKTVKHLIMSEDFWDTLKLDTGLETHPCHSVLLR